ncbi:MAG: DUF192 domain-containing protein [Acidobacteria bacterium]|jgi:hypothetical protein|nr:DUF192 domain-containing protein [Acidobacteriota bacterium]
MKKTLLFLMALAHCRCAAAGGAPARFMTIFVQDKPFRVEIADTPEKHALGLMHRRLLKSDYGMLFIFADEEVRSFWMKDTLIPLDMIFINSDHQVVDLVHEVPPCPGDPCPSYTSAYPARFVLEIAGGTAKKLKLVPGDKIFMTID